MDNEIMFTIGGDDVLREYKEPYATIECETEEVYNRIVEAFEKHNNVKRPYTLHNTPNHWYCETCGALVYYKEADTFPQMFCQSCGQKLDWSDIND